MAKRKEKGIAEQPLALDNKAIIVDRAEKNEGSTTDREVESQVSAIKAISDMEVQHLLTRLQLVRSYFNEDQLQIRVLKFFKENLPNVAVVRNSEDNNFDLRWKDEDGNFSAYDTRRTDIHTSLLHQMSLAYPICPAERQSFGGLQFSAQTFKSHGGADDLQFGNYLSQESFNTAMLGLPEGLQTPGATSQRLSVGMTPKTVRVPKHGEMLLSVHGSPLGVYREDNMEAIHESEES